MGRRRGHRKVDRGLGGERSLREGLVWVGHSNKMLLQTAGAWGAGGTAWWCTVRTCGEGGMYRSLLPQREVRKPLWGWDPCGYRSSVTIPLKELAFQVQPGGQMGVFLFICSYLLCALEIGFCAWKGWF